MKKPFAELDGVALGIALGLVSGLWLFLATAILLLKEGKVDWPQSFTILSYYFLGFKVTWLGASLGLPEGGIEGFLLGSMIASLQNWENPRLCQSVETTGAGKGRTQSSQLI